jgi:hypothetical protein
LNFERAPLELQRAIKSEREREREREGRRGEALGSLWEKKKSRAI